MAEQFEYLGHGIVLPFRITSHGDFDHRSGIDNLRSAVRLLLGTQKGEFPWDPDFGLDLTRMLHRPLTEDLKEEATRAVVEGFKAEPRIKIQDVRAEITKDSGLELTLSWSIVGGISVGGEVNFSDTVVLD